MPLGWPAWLAGSGVGPGVCSTVNAAAVVATVLLLPLLRRHGLGRRAGYASQGELPPGLAACMHACSRVRMADGILRDGSMRFSYGRFGGAVWACVGARCSLWARN